MDILTVDFTREPIIETVITPKDGCKLVVRSSKSPGQEEYFVDALEVVCFGSGLFYRSLERPKSFLVPASDYEILEVREARMVLKNVGIERSIKLGSSKHPKEAVEKPVIEAEPTVAIATQESALPSAESRVAAGKRDRRRHTRRRRGATGELETEAEAARSLEAEGPTTAPKQEEGVEAPSKQEVTPGVLSSLLPPPTRLISETIAQYRENFQSAFYIKDQEPIIEEEAAAIVGIEQEEAPRFNHPEDLLEAVDLQGVMLEPPEYGSFGSLEDEESSKSFFPREETTDAIEPSFEEKE